ncbi:hypothetical protein SCUCBS95973_002581 [Sporothrix curviconia]|uniref:Large ribosomal subunit protein mL54 n=1 Tax=Sporothrix curviconia TaxID=1260050 RepID=A0ABP0B850_9PEZI
MASTVNVCRTVLLRRTLAQSMPARASRPVFGFTSSSSSSSTLHSSPFSTSPVSRNASPAAPKEAPSPDADAAVPPPAAAISSCPEGTVLLGLNYTKGKTDPVALRDEDYPEWLWKCLEVMKKADTEEAADAGDEFSKSKKQRRMALKRQRELEAKVLATGDLTALAPKIPLQHQSLNLTDDSGAETDTMAAAERRKELRVAMRKERRAKIKETNYLRSM